MQKRLAVNLPSGKQADERELWVMRRRALFAQVCLLSVVSCTTVYRVPPTLTSQHYETLKNSPFSNLVIGIETTPEQDEYYVSKFITLFTGCALFKEVALDSALSSTPDLIVQLQSQPPMPYCVPPGGFFAMIMTLGLVPLQEQSDLTYSFTILDPQKLRTLDLEFTCTLKSYLGSLTTALMKASANWSSSPQDARNYELFAYELVSKGAEILELIESGKLR